MEGPIIKKYKMDIPKTTTELAEDILKSINDFAIGSQSIINQAVNTGDPAPLLQALTTRREKLVQLWINFLFFLNFFFF